MSIKKRFEMKDLLTKLVACYADGEGGEGEVVDSGLSATPEGTSSQEEPVSAPPAEKIDYVGSEAVNPDQRPLRDIDLADFGSKEELDKFIMEYGEEIFLTDEEIAERDGKKKEEKKPEDDDDEQEDDPAPKKEEKEEEPETPDEDAQEFLKEVGLTAEEFGKLPEKVQERLAEGFSGNAEISTKASEFEAKYNELRKATEQLEQDPTIAARLEELASGKNYTAKDLPTPSKEELEKLMDAALDEGDFQKALNEYIASKAEQVIKVERSVAERKAAEKQLEQDATKVIQEMVEKEKRIGIKEKNPDKIFGHDAWKGDDGLLNFFKKHNFTMAHIRDMGADKLLTLLSVDRGWDKEREKKIHKQGATSLLQKIREAQSKARTIDMGKKSALPKSGRDSGGYDRNSLIADIASGTSNNWEKLLERADQIGDRKTVNDLVAIREEAMAQLREKNTPSNV